MSTIKSFVAALTAIGAPTLDIDGSTSYGALTDGLLIIPFQFPLSFLIMAAPVSSSS